MQHTHSRILLIAVTFTAVLLAGFTAAVGSACIGPLGCGLACTACSCLTDACTELSSQAICYEPDDHMWDGPGSIQETPIAPIIDVTAIPFTEEPVLTPEPVSEPDPTPIEQSALDGQQPAQIETLFDLREKQVRLRNDGTDTATVLILMNGSDLESEYEEASTDISEMLRATGSDRVNVVMQTVGTRKWSSKYGISSRHTQRWQIGNGRLTLVDDSLAQLDTTIPSTLGDFIRWGAQNYPADRYILILWDHGGGPVYGFGYDEFQPYSSTLTIDEMQTALRDGGVYFDVIGMDSCLMSSLEVCCALYDYCDYMVLSEDFEPGCGWSYTGWLSALAKNPAIDTPALGQIMIDDSVRYCETHLSTDGGMTLALIDESYMKLLYPAWVGFAYANEEALLNANYSQLRQSTGRAHPRIRSVSDWFNTGDSTMQDYCVTDILSVAQNIQSDESAALVAALAQSIVCYGATSDETTLTGMSVTLPYGDRDFYTELRRVFRSAGFDAEYVDWLERFTAVETTTDSYYDFGGWSDLWGGWDDTQDVFDWNTWFYDDGEAYEDEWLDDDWFSWFFGG